MSEHYFTSKPFVSGETERMRVWLSGGEREVVSAPGVFSRQGVDRGTRVLLDYLDDFPADVLGDSGDLLDLGCGWGAIALSVSLRLREGLVSGVEGDGCDGVARRVWAVDVNERARQLCALNAAGLGCEGVLSVAPEQVPEGVLFSRILSNPPIRVGKRELYGLLDFWFSRLLPGGVAFLVVAKQLGAESLASRFGAERVYRGRGFHVLRVGF